MAGKALPRKVTFQLDLKEQARFYQAEKGRKGQLGKGNSMRKSTAAHWENAEDLAWLSRELAEKRVGE